MWISHKNGVKSLPQLSVNVIFRQFYKTSLSRLYKVQSISRPIIAHSLQSPAPCIQQRLEYLQNHALLTEPQALVICVQ
jgi:hypothetical protein